MHHAAAPGTCGADHKFLFLNVTESQRRAIICPLSGITARRPPPLHAPLKHPAAITVHAFHAAVLQLSPLHLAPSSTKLLRPFREYLRAFSG